MSDRRTSFRDWPNEGSSRFVRAGGFGWHVQVMGEGPVVLMLHGTAASTHSWRGLAPLLARRFRVVAPDLPGHGFTETPAARRLSPEGMAGAVRALLGVLGERPALIVGHSAGAVVALRLVLDGSVAAHGAVRGVVSLNGALQPLSGAAGQVFAPLAKLLVGVPGVPALFAWRAKDRKVVEKLLADTGSRIDARGVGLYARLFADRRHTGAALAMMAHWDLKPTMAELPGLACKLLLVVGERDRAVPPAVADTVAGLVPQARVVRMPGLGHLSHEEDPAGTAALIEGFADELGL